MEKLGPIKNHQSKKKKKNRIILAPTKVCQISIEINLDFQCGNLPTEF